MDKVSSVVKFFHQHMHMRANVRVQQIIRAVRCLSSKGSANHSWLGFVAGKAKRVFDRRKACRH